MNYTVALLYVLIGTFDEMKKEYAIHPELGSADFIPYQGGKGKCVINIKYVGGEETSRISITPSVSPDVNPVYDGVSDNGLSKTYFSKWAVTANMKPVSGEFVLLNEASDFKVLFESHVNQMKYEEVISCDAKSCTCAVKL